jgi:transcriptional regulator with XRE-family HTH domain
MRQEDLAARIGKTRSLISHIERTGNVNNYTKKEIATILQCDPEEFEITEPSFQDQNLTFHKQNNYEQIQVFENLIKELKSEIVYLKGIINQQWELIKKFEEGKK